MKTTIRVAVVDDEPLARQRIEDLLAKEEGIEVVATAATGDEALEIVRRTLPDLLFLDVQMPGKTGLEVVAELGKDLGVDDMPVTIFVTAFDQFALKAFDLAAVDYLVKPFDDERFAQALRRARHTVELEEVREMTQRLMALVGPGGSAEDASAAALPPAAAPARQPARAPEYLDRIPVEQRGQVRVVPVERIDYITASGPYAELHAGDKTFAVRERMQTLEERLDPAVFFRIHRSVIARLDRIDTLLRSSGGDYGVRLKSGTELPVSRSRREELEAKMGIR
jgi:two-component system LytT family response regulator